MSNTPEYLILLERIRKLAGEFTQIRKELRTCAMIARSNADILAMINALYDEMSDVVLPPPPHAVISKLDSDDEDDDFCFYLRPPVVVR